MKKRFVILMLLIGSLFLSACNSYNVKPLPLDARLKTIYIEHNPKVIVDDFEDVLVDAIRKAGLNAKVVDAPVRTSSSKYVLRYTAKQSWDVVTYLTYADIEIYKGTTLQAFGTYRHRGGPYSLSFFKWQGTESKMTPLYEELFDAYVPF